jgi:DNA (cytosine-5)-methyltransferase 1
MNTEFAIVDLFAGPGGLAEGFSSLRTRDGSRPFHIALSVEKEPSAFETLRLRSFLRQFNDGFPPEYYRFLNGEIPEPEWHELFSEEWKAAVRETVMLELGSRGSAAEIDARLERISRSHRGNVILIGGPPCQAYSLVGRARNKGTEGYDAGKDHRRRSRCTAGRRGTRLHQAARKSETRRALSRPAVQPRKSGAGKIGDEEVCHHDPRCHQVGGSHEIRR